MKNRRMQIAAAFALLAVLGKFYAEPLRAQIRAALVQNVDEPGRHPFALRKNTEQSFTSWAVPNGLRYVIEAYGASCGVDSPASLTDISIRVPNPNGPDAQFASTAPHAFYSYFSNNVLENGSTGSAVTRLYAEPGDTIVLQTSNSTGIAVTRNCQFSVSGYAITLP